MRIAINCRSFLKQNYAGIGRYAFNLVQSLGAIDPHNEYWLYVQKKYFDFKKHPPRVHARNFHVKIDWLGRGIDTVLRPIDIYHSPSPDNISITDAKIVVTVHDLVYKTYPQGHTQSTIETTEKQMNVIAQKADHIICCSHSTIHDLCQHFPIDKNKVSLVYQGVDNKVFFPVDNAEKAIARRLLKRKGISEPFILYVGTIEPRKNLQNLILAFSELKHKERYSGKLVVVGMRGWMVEGLAQVINRFNLANDVIFPGYVPDAVLRYLYNLADAFVFPSFYEGFGFPIVEAFSCGAAVVTSRVSSCPEIAGDAALTVDPYNPADIEQAIEKIIRNPELRDELKAKAVKRAQDFSFRKTAEETLKVYEKVVKT